MNLTKIEFIAYIYILLLIIHKLKLFIVLEIMQFCLLIFNRINGFVGVQNLKAEQPV